MVNKYLRASDNQGRGQAETIKCTLFEGLLTSQNNGQRFHYVRDFGFENITNTSRIADMSEGAQKLLQILFRYNLQHKITSRGLRISITSHIRRITGDAGKSL